MLLSTLSLVALIALAVVATVLVAIAAIRLARERRPEPLTATPGTGPRWFEVVLAVAVLVMLVVVAIFVLLELPGEGMGANDWRTDARSVLFLSAMLALAALALLFLMVFLIARRARPRTEAREVAAVSASDPLPQPAASRLLGLLLLAIGILLIGWIQLDASARAALVSQALYPAAIAVAIVLLFDKATRSWTPKGSIESFREWLLCDILALALVLGFTNILQLESRATYGGFLCDVIHIVGFFFVFWVIDRSAFRARFLVGFGYLTLLPLLLLLWRLGQDLTSAENVAWWHTIWPVFFLSLGFFLLEIIALLGFRGAREHAIPAVKDTLYLVLLTVFLIVAVPGAE